MSIPQAIISCRRIKFYSTSDDKDAFFNWLKAMTFIVHVKGVKDTLQLAINLPIADEDLYRLVALCRRYNIEPEALGALVTVDNQEFFQSCGQGFSISVYPVSTEK